MFDISLNGHVGYFGYRNVNPEVPQIATYTEYYLMFIAQYSILLCMVHIVVKIIRDADQDYLYNYNYP